MYSNSVSSESPLLLRESVVRAVSVELNEKYLPLRIEEHDSRGRSRTLPSMLWEALKK